MDKSDFESRHGNIEDFTRYYQNVTSDNLEMLADTGIITDNMEAINFGVMSLAKIVSIAAGGNDKDFEAFLTKALSSCGEMAKAFHETIQEEEAILKGEGADAARQMIDKIMAEAKQRKH